MHAVRTGWWRAWVLLGALLAGCVSTPPAQVDLLDFLQPGVTTREAVVLRLGQPSGSYEADRILTYRIGEAGEKGYYIISPRVISSAAAPYHKERFSLVLVFDAEGRLRRHQLVRVY